MDAPMLNVTPDAGIIEAQAPYVPSQQTAGVSPKAALEAVFDEFDTNHDGRISRAEFDALAAKHPRLPLREGTSGWATAKLGAWSLGSSRRPISFSPSPPDTHRSGKRSARRHEDPKRAFFFYLGPVILGVLCIIPLFEANVLKNSAAYMYFGTLNPPLMPILLAFGALLLLLHVLDVSVIVPGFFLGGHHDPGNAWLSRAMSSWHRSRVRPEWNLEAIVVTITFIFFLCIWSHIPAHGTVTRFASGSSGVTNYIVFSCVGTMLLYVVVLRIFLHCSPREAQNAGNYLLIWGIFALFLGVFLVVFSMQLTRDAADIQTELYSVGPCGDGPRSSRIFEISQTLQALRAVPECAGLDSVEMCRGFGASEQSQFLRALEKDLHCSGWCFRGTDSLPELPLEFRTRPIAAMGGGANQTPPVWKTLYETKQPTQEHHIYQVGKKVIPYPPTLFSQAQYQSSCDGAAARDMKFTVGGAGWQLLYEGVLLVVFAFCAGFVKMIALCSLSADAEGEELEAATGNYGSIASEG